MTNLLSLIRQLKSSPSHLRQLEASINTVTNDLLDYSQPTLLLNENDTSCSFYAILILEKRLRKLVDLRSELLANENENAQAEQPYKEKQAYYEHGLTLYIQFLNFTLQTCMSRNILIITNKIGLVYAKTALFFYPLYLADFFGLLSQNIHNLTVLHIFKSFVGLINTSLEIDTERKHELKRLCRDDVLKLSVFIAQHLDWRSYGEVVEVFGELFGFTKDLDLYVKWVVRNYLILCNEKNKLSAQSGIYNDQKNKDGVDGFIEHHPLTLDVFEANRCLTADFLADVITHKVYKDYVLIIDLLNHVNDIELVKACFNGFIFNKTKLPSSIIRFVYCYMDNLFRQALILLLTHFRIVKAEPEYEGVVVEVVRKMSLVISAEKAKQNGIVYNLKTNNNVNVDIHSISMTFKKYKELTIELLRVFCEYYTKQMVLLLIDEKDSLDVFIVMNIMKLTHTRKCDNVNVANVIMNIKFSSPFLNCYCDYLFFKKGCVSYLMDLDYNCEDQALLAIKIVKRFDIDTPTLSYILCLNENFKNETEVSFYKDFAIFALWDDLLVLCLFELRNRQLTQQEGEVLAKVHQKLLGKADWSIQKKKVLLALLKRKFNDGSYFLPDFINYWQVTDKVNDLDIMIVGQIVRIYTGLETRHTNRDKFCEEDGQLKIDQNVYNNILSILATKINICVVDDLTLIVSEVLVYLDDDSFVGLLDLLFKKFGAVYEEEDQKSSVTFLKHLLGGLEIRLKSIFKNDKANNLLDINNDKLTPQQAQLVNNIVVYMYHIFAVPELCVIKKVRQIYNNFSIFDRNILARQVINHYTNANLIDAHDELVLFFIHLVKDKSQDYILTDVFGLDVMGKLAKSLEDDSLRVKKDVVKGFLAGFKGNKLKINIKKVGKLGVEKKVELVDLYGNG